jgi:hypothetical protein
MIPGIISGLIPGLRRRALRRRWHAAPQAGIIRAAMRVFLAGIIQGSFVEAKIHDQDWRARLRAAIERHLPGADVYCHYSRHPNSITYGLLAIRETIEEGNRRAADCDVLVAYVPSASMGTAIEMYEAWRHGAVVLTISPLEANWVIRAYSDRVFRDVAAFEAFLGGAEAADLMAAGRRAGRFRRPDARGEGPA